MTSLRVSKSTHAPLTSYWSGLSGLIFSIYRSITSGPVFVRPQAIRSLWPMTTPGTPRKRETSDLRADSLAPGRQCMINLVPDRRHLDTQMGIIGQQRFPAGSSAASEDPIIGPDAAASAAKMVINRAAFR